MQCLVLSAARMPIYLGKHIIIIIIFVITVSDVLVPVYVFVLSSSSVPRG